MCIRDSLKAWGPGARSPSGGHADTLTRRMTLRIRRRVGLAVAVGLLGVATGAVPVAGRAVAQTVAPRLVLVAQDAWAPVGGQLHLTVEAAGVGSGLTLR